MYTVARQAILTTEGYSIKDLEKYYNFQRTGDVRKAVQSEEYYIEWLETQDQKYLDALGAITQAQKQLRSVLSQKGKEIWTISVAVR